MEFIVVADELAVIERLQVEVEKCANAAIAANGVFHCGLSGGSLANYLSVAIPKMSSDFSKWQLYFCDERYVDETDADSIYGVYKKNLITSGTLKSEQFVRIDQQLPLDECAADYERKIRAAFGDSAGPVPVFDLLLLGMGPDGHTCSLFPEHALLQEKSKLIAALNDSPKPPPARVTMTLPLINNAKCCMFAMCGDSKADMVKRVFIEHAALPAAMVAPHAGALIGIFDKAASKYLK